MSHGFSNVHGIRTTVTVSHGTVDGTSVTNSTVALAGLTTADRVVACPQAQPAAALMVGTPRVSAAGLLEIPVVNTSTATVSAGTAVVYNVEIFKATGSV